MVVQGSQQYASEIHRLAAECATSRGWTWSKFIESAGLYRSHGTAIARGSHPTPSTIKKLADAMGMPRDELLVVAGYAPEGGEGNLTGDELRALNFFRQAALNAETKRLALEMLGVLARQGSQLGLGVRGAKTHRPHQGAPA